MSIHEFAQAIHVQTPLGHGLALFVETGNHEQNWTVALTKSRAFVTFQQKFIRIAKSYSDRRGITDEQMMQIIEPPPEPT